METKTRMEKTKENNNRSKKIGKRIGNMEQRRERSKIRRESKKN